MNTRVFCLDTLLNTALSAKYYAGRSVEIARIIDGKTHLSELIQTLGDRS